VEVVVHGAGANLEERPHASPAEGARRYTELQAAVVQPDVRIARCACCRQWYVDLNVGLRVPEVSVERNARRELERQLRPHDRGVVGRQRRARAPAEETSKRQVPYVRRELHHFITRLIDHTQPPLRAQRRGSRDQRDDAQGNAGSFSHRFLRYEMSCAHTSRRRHAPCPTSAITRYTVDTATLARGTVRHHRPCRCPRPGTGLSTHW